MFATKNDNVWRGMEIVMLTGTPLVMLFCMHKLYKEYQEHRKRKKIQEDE